jgi:hypothetical protein
MDKVIKLIDFIWNQYDFVIITIGVLISFSLISYWIYDSYKVLNQQKSILTLLIDDINTELEEVDHKIRSCDNLTIQTAGLIKYKTSLHLLKLKYQLWINQLRWWKM